MAPAAAAAIQTFTKTQPRPKKKGRMGKEMVIITSIGGSRRPCEQLAIQEIMPGKANEEAVIKLICLTFRTGIKRRQSILRRYGRVTERTERRFSRS